MGARELTVEALPFQQGLIHTLTLIAEEGRLSSPYGINVLRYAPVAEAFFAAEERPFRPLPEGELCPRHRAGREGRKGAADLPGRAGKGEELPEEAEADILLPHIQMMDFLFAQSGTAGVTGKQPVLEAAWFPLPFCMSEEDNS